MLALVSAATAAIASRETDQESSEPEELKNRLEENEYIRTVVITDAEDTFFLQMPVCLICGSIGKDVEGTMVSCATCAQSYHTFCVGLHNTVSRLLVGYVLLPYIYFFKVPCKFKKKFSYFS